MYNFILGRHWHVLQEVVGTLAMFANTVVNNYQTIANILATLGEQNSQ
jgi:hypothetical protein